MPGCWPRKPGSRGVSQPAAKLGAECTRRSCGPCAEIDSSPRRSSSKALRTWCISVSPLIVRLTVRPLRSNSATPSAFSSFITAWLTALGERLSSAAAARNEPRRAAASKARTAGRETWLSMAGSERNSCGSVKRDGAPPSHRHTHVIPDKRQSRADPGSIARRRRRSRIDPGAPLRYVRDDGVVEQHDWQSSQMNQIHP